MRGYGRVPPRIEVPPVGFLWIDDLDGDVIPGFEAGDDGLEFLNVMDGVTVERNDDTTLEVADADLIGEGPWFHGLDENAMQTGRSALGQVLDGDAEFGGRDGARSAILAFLRPPHCWQH